MPVTHVYTHGPNVAPHDSPLISATVPCGHQEFKQTALPPAAENSQGFRLQSEIQEVTERQYRMWSQSFKFCPLSRPQVSFSPHKVVLPLTLPGAIWMAKGQMVKCSQEKACLNCFLSSDFLGAFNLRTLLCIPKIRECDGVCSISRHYFPLELSLMKNPTGLAPRRAHSGKLFSLCLPHHHPAIIPTLV